MDRDDLTQSQCVWVGVLSSVNEQNICACNESHALCGVRVLQKYFVDNRVCCAVSGMTRHTNHPSLVVGWCGCVFPEMFVGGFCDGVTPGPFPNPEAKPVCADGTAPGRVWESRSPPASKILNMV